METVDLDAGESVVAFQQIVLGRDDQPFGSVGERRAAGSGPGLEVVRAIEAASFTGDPPSRPSYIGMLAASAQSKRGDTWTITDFQVTEPQ